jgi:hypothetical protein
MMPDHALALGPYLDGIVSRAITSARGDNRARDQSQRDVSHGSFSMDSVSIRRAKGCVMDGPYREPGIPAESDADKRRRLTHEYWALAAVNAIGKTPAELAEITRRMNDLLLRISKLRP